MIYKIDNQSYQHFEKREEDDVEACFSGRRQKSIYFSFVFDENQHN